MGPYKNGESLKEEAHLLSLRESIFYSHPLAALWMEELARAMSFLVRATPSSSRREPNPEPSLPNTRYCGALPRKPVCSWSGLVAAFCEALCDGFYTYT